MKVADNKGKEDEDSRKDLESKRESKNRILKKMEQD
jgi:hypothetical protein